MNSIERHLPGFCDIIESDNNKVEFSTVEELLSIPFVKIFQDKRFSHYAIADGSLLAIYNDGLEWMVVGHIKDVSTVDLPEWDGPKYKIGSPAIIKNAKVE